MNMPTSDRCPVCDRPITGWDIKGRPKAAKDGALTRPVQEFAPCRCAVSPPVYPER